MKKILIRIIVSIVAMLIVGGIVIIAWALRGPSLKSDQFTFVSAPPESSMALDPYFMNCDSIPCSCECDDPFDPRIKSGAGDFEGQCLNSCITRSVVEISAEKAREIKYFTPETGNMKNAKNVHYLVNISHNPNSDEESFYAACVEPAFITDIVYQVEHAGGLQGHAEIRFIFDPSHPVILVPQKTDVVREESHVTDLIYSVEMIAPPGVPYKGDYGFREQFFQRYRMCSLDAKAHQIIKVLHHRVWQYRLKMSQREKTNIFLAAIKSAASADPDERYHTTKRNCSIRAFEAIDRGARISWFRKPLMFITNNTLFLPTRAAQHLRYRGLAPKNKDNFQMKNLEVELDWEGYIDESLYSEG